MSRQLIGLGRAVDLKVKRFDTGGLQTVPLPGHWWAWDGKPSTGNILLVKPRTVSDAKGTAGVVAAHQHFHGSAPTGFLDVDAQKITPPFADIGLAVSITYDAQHFSHSKKDAPYRHFFGAETHDDKPPFADELLPFVSLDRHNQVVIRRRATNTFRLEDWIVG